MDAFKDFGFVPIFAVAESHSEKRIKNKKTIWGYSFHIVIKNIIGYKKDIKKFAIKLNQHINEHQNTDYIFKYKEENKNIDITAIFDTSVYNTGVQKFRSVYSSKDGEDRPFNLILGTFQDMIISGSTADDANVYIPVVNEIKNPSKDIIKIQDQNPLQASEDVVKVPSNVWNINMKEIEEEIKTLVVDETRHLEILKYYEYAMEITGKQIDKEYYPLQKASSNLGIPFEIFDKVVCSKKMIIMEIMIKLIMKKCIKSLIMRVKINVDGLL
jgi:hypothetical protein